MTLLAKAESRRSSTVFSLAPAGAGKLDEMPERDEFEATDDGTRAWMANFFDFLDKNFSSSGGQGRALDQHELRAGFFGEWHARNGHGRIVQWEKEENGYRLQPITSGGEPVVPSVAAVCAFALQVYVYVCVIVHVANARKPSRTQGACMRVRLGTASQEKRRAPCCRWRRATRNGARRAAGRTTAAGHGTSCSQAWSREPT